MKHWSVARIIAVSAGATVALIVLLGTVSALLLTSVSREVEHMRTGSQARSAAGAQFRAAWQNGEGLILMHVMQDDVVALNALEPQITANRAEKSRLFDAYGSTAPDAAHRQLMEQAEAARSEYNRITDELLSLSRSPQTKSAAERLLFSRLVPAFMAVDSLVARLAALDGAETAASDRAVLAAIRTMEISEVAVLAVVILLAVLSARRLYAVITTQLGQLVAVGIQVDGSVTEIAATSKENQATATEIAATTTEIGATAREISATSRELGRTMSEVASAAEQSATIAGSGQAGLARMEDTMRQVTEATAAINAKLAVLNEKAGNINQVVTTITKVADQTNLLSLNAAIEAEKAGEYGRGFAVVATEIRRLADQTGVATYDIGQMVKEIQSAVSAGVMGMDKFSEEVRRAMHEVTVVGDQLSQIITQVQTLAPRVESVNEGMQAQATGAEQISQALSQLSEASRQTVESMTQANEAVAGLSRASGTLRESVLRFKG